MDFEREIKRKLEAEGFAENNGKIIRIVNILAGEWTPLSMIKSALENDMEGHAFDKSMLFLVKSGYLEIRGKRNRQAAEWEDRHRQELEVALSGKGMKLALYHITDEAVRV